MFQRISTGWQLTKQSFQVLRLDKELLVFPLLSGIACGLVLATFALPMFASGFLEAMAKDNAGGEQATKVLGYVILFAYYVVNYFVIIFFNSALVACAIIRFKGGNPTLKDGLSAAAARFPQILGWAIVAATVGLMLRAIESRSEAVGRIVAGLIGMAWTAVTYFVVPVIVIEKTGPLAAIKRSTAVLKKTWGEALTANFGIGVITFFVSLLAFVPIVLGVLAFMAENAVLGIIGIACGVVLLLLISLVSSALHAIIVGALYLYAAEGKVPEQFDDQLLRDAFAKKK